MKYFLMNINTGQVELARNLRELCEITLVGNPKEVTDLKNGQTTKNGWELIQKGER